MVEIKKNKFLNFAKKSSPKILLIGGIIVAATLFHAYHHSKKIFNFPTKGSVIKNVSEEGELSFSSGGKLKLKNSYLAKESITKSGSTVKIEGVTAGEFDKNLKPLIKSSNYSVVIEQFTPPDKCDEKFAAQYPSFLRRLVYYMPNGALFNGQKWKIDACNSQLTCNYTFAFHDKRGNVEMMCSGQIGNTEIAVTGDLKVNRKFNGFSETSLEIFAESPEITSSWKFLENSKTK
ncbi:MAG: hypothetical protein ACOX2F_00375 [bacterium]